MAKKKVAETQLIKVGHKALIVGALAVLVCGAVFWLFTRPATTAADAANLQLLDAQTQLQAQEAKLADLKSGKQRSATSLLQRSAALDRSLPAEIQPTDLVAIVDNMARNSGVVLGQMNPGAGTVKAGNALGTTFDVQLSGSTTAIAGLLGQIQEMDPLVTVSGFDMTSSSDASGQGDTTAATLKMTSWSFPQPVLDMDAAANGG